VNEAPPSSSALLRPSLARDVDRVCTQFEIAWKDGGQPRIEAFLGGAAEPERSALLHELVLLDAHYRRDQGERPAAGDYEVRFPADVSLIRAAFAEAPPAEAVQPASESTGVNERSDAAAARIGAPNPGDPAATPPVAGAGAVPGNARFPAVPGYEILSELGRGGMGVVYRARDRALDREVAVKILQEQYAPDSSTALRFLDEARVTGQLQHPVIPAVYQVGHLADDRPFLAMKLIQGQTLDQLLKANASVDALAVFEAVCQAVGYAHAHGVIHRDLKPGNVMVGSFGEVQVMDWGLAKVLSARRPPERPAAGPDATAAPTVTYTERHEAGPFTQEGAVLGTLAYMAPEQAAGELHKIDARTDVFGLGALLCVLLTGRPPFEGQHADSVRLQAVRGQTAAALARLDACPADPAVVALCRRCLAFAPGERPATGDAVAAAVAGLRRAADERAKQAERDRLAAEVRAAEQAKRRRTVQWAAGVVVAVLLLGVAGTTIGLLGAEAARRDAEQAERQADKKRAEAEAAQQAEREQRAKAEAKEAEATAVVTFFQEQVFAAARPKGQRGGLGSSVSLQEALAASLAALDKGFADQPLIEARLRTTLGNTFGYLGKTREAAAQHEQARALYTQQLGPDAPLTLESLSNLAADYHTLGRRTDALKLREETLAACRRVLDPDDPLTLKCMHNLAVSYGALGRMTDALKLLEETVSARRRVLGSDHEETLGSMHNLANCYFAVGRRDEALTLRKETLAGSRRVLGPDHPRTLAAMNTLANSYFALDRFADAGKLQEDTLAARRRVLSPDHPDTLTTMNNLANSYEALGRADDAHKLREETLAASRRVYGPDHPETLRNMGSLAESLVKRKRGTEAIPLIDDCVARAAGKALDPGLIPGVMDLRLRHFQQAGDPAGCRTTAEMWEKLQRSDPGSLYRAARYRAVAAAVQTTTPASDAARLAKDDADRAIVWLTRAIAAGYKDRAHLEKDKDLDAVRGRGEFQKLLVSLPATAPPAGAEP